MNITKVIIALSLLILLSITGFSCTTSPTELLNRAIVQVLKPAEAGEPEEQMSLGIVVGDGNQVLALMNYEEYSTGNLIILTKNHKRYTAIFQAVDTRTGITLFKLDNVRLPSVTLGNSQITPSYGAKVIVWRWDDSNQVALTSLSATVSPDQAPRPLFFSISYGENEELDIPGIVTDNQGNILGLMNSFHNRLVQGLGPIGRAPLVANIDNARELLSGKDQYTSLDSPVLSTLAGKGDIKGYFGGILPSPSNYNDMSVALFDLLGKLGEPIETSDLNINNSVGWYGFDSISLIVVYPRSIELKNNDGDVLAQAKWISIQWDRSDGSPNRLFYGDVPYTIKVGFELIGDITNLQLSIPPLNN